MLDRYRSNFGEASEACRASDVRVRHVSALTTYGLCLYETDCCFQVRVAVGGPGARSHLSWSHHQQLEPILP